MANPVTAPTPKDYRKRVMHGCQRRFLAGSGAGWDQATWRTNGTADTTTWIYQESTGLLTAKTYADSNVTAYTYDSAGRLATRTWARQVSSQDLVTTYSYDANTGELTGIDYSYDSEGRFGELETAVPSSFTATYGYLEDSNLVETVTLPGSITATKSYEANRDLLAAVTNKVGQTTISQYTYTNDAAGRRTGADWSGSAFSLGQGQGNDSIAYGYNSRSEVTTAIATTRTAYDFDYTYDNIGNRVDYAVAGGTATTYERNELNQYTVTLNPTEAFVYDDDGNLIEDGDFVYAWDAENRLIEVRADGIVKVEFTYDYMSRRVRKVSSDWQGGNWVQQTDQKFVYDGWNPILELASGGELPASTARTWGLDLSQTLQGAGLPAIAWQATAGGVGGLLATHLSGQVNAFVYDGNGNVSEALRVSNGSIEAHYEYDPFGNSTFIDNQTWAAANPFRFSTKWFDDETSLYYYGLRYYSPRLGRWASRDPIGQRGGRNIYSLVGNGPTCFADYIGLLVVYIGGAMEETQGQLPWFQADVGADFAYAWDANAQVLAKIKETINGNPCEPIIIIGHSWGGDTALDVAEALADEKCLQCLYVVALDPVSQLDPDAWFGGPNPGQQVTQWINVAQPAGFMDVVFDIPIVGWIAGGFWSGASAVVGSDNGVATGGGQWNSEPQATFDIPAVGPNGQMLGHSNVAGMMNVTLPGMSLTLKQYLDILKSQECCQ